MALIRGVVYGGECDDDGRVVLGYQVIIQEAGGVVSHYSWGRECGDGWNVYVRWVDVGVQIP